MANARDNAEHPVLVNSSLDLVFYTGTRGARNLAKQHVAVGGHASDRFLLQTLRRNADAAARAANSARLIAASLLSHCVDLLGSQIRPPPGQALFGVAINVYIDEHYATHYRNP